jgi:hexosaminidase
MRKVLVLICFLLCAFILKAQGPEVIVPVPEKYVLSEGTYTFEGVPRVDARIVPSRFDGREDYSLEVNSRGVVIRAGGEAGLFYARQTLAQMTSGGAVTEIRCCRIEDSPRYAYRGLHVDVSRHFRSVDFLKKQMDAMAFFKMNRMHLHLTDAAGWRLEIEAYPRLTRFAAWRPEALWKSWWNGGRQYADEGTEGVYGGYYTKEDIAELVSYAAERHIELIPEIEMPSHSEEVLAAYPELGCTGEAYKDSDFCVGNEDVFTFLETVLTEVMEMFPSEYIHIGGDEAGKEHWKTCPKCLRRMQDEGIADVDGLQSYMIRRIGNFIASKGRKMIGWDEILQGGLAPGAVVMSWRGTEGGIEAMSQGHDVIMTPGRYCYLDHAQDAPFREPESIGGYLPLDSVYVYEPVEARMPQDRIQHILGLQANLWSEYIPDDAHAEYMYWPRAFAIAETAWSTPERKNLQDFRRRALNMLELMKRRGYNVFDLSNEYGERKLAQTGLEHKAKGKPVKYLKPVQQWYPAAGETTFTDGVIGGWTYSDKRWQGFLSEIDVIIDLETVQDIHYIGGTFMQLKGPGVFMPEKVEIQVSSDGENFIQVAEVWNDVSVNLEELLFKSFDTICNVQARYIRYRAARSTMRGFLFLDEVIVN